MGQEAHEKKTKKEKKDEEVIRKRTKTEILKRDVFKALSVD